MSAAEELLRAVTALFAIANPIAAAPFFASLTEGWDESRRRRAEIRAAAIVATILAIAALAGGTLLGWLGVSLDAFRTAGGLIITLMGLEMLGGRPTRVQHEPPLPEDAEADDPIVVPFAMPLVAGPGAITTVVTLSSAREGHLPIVLGAIVILAIALLVALRLADRIEDHLSRRGQAIFRRFMGLLLASVGTQFVIDGLQGAFGFVG